MTIVFNAIRKTIQVVGFAAAVFLIALGEMVTERQGGSAPLAIRECKAVEAHRVAANPAGTRGMGLGDWEAGNLATTGDWWGTAASQIAEIEYRASSNVHGLQAPNRAHNFRTYFESRGIQLEPRVPLGDEVEPWTLAWTTLRFGRGQSLSAVEPATPEANGARIVYRREAFDEWYDNSAKGMEQGFLVHERPHGKGSLCFRGKFSGSLEAKFDAQAKAIDLVDQNGARALRYAELHVFDANGTTVPAELGLEGNEVCLVIDDAHATYPLTVDPLLSSPAWTVESNQGGARLGFSVATAGDVNGDGFSDVLAGARTFDNGETDEGKVFLYLGSSAGLSIVSSWSAESNQGGAEMGWAVATAGDVNGDGYSDVALAARSFDDGETDEGRVSVYLGSPGGLATNAAWVVNGNQAGAFFGQCVAAAGDVNGDGFGDLLVGAPSYDNGHLDEGSAFLYAGTATGLAGAPMWTFEGQQIAANCGHSVATAGDVNADGFSDVIVSAPAFDNGEVDEGRAFIFHGSSTGLSLAANRTLESNQLQAFFGISVTTAGDVNRDGYSDIIIGAHAFDNGELNEGRVFAYDGSVLGIGSSPAWTIESNQAGATMGQSIGPAGDVNGDGFADVIIGAYGMDHGSTNEGQAFVYSGSFSGLGTIPTWSGEGDQANAFYGWAVGTAGDVNGDGFGDVIVGIQAYDGGATDEGRAAVYHGSGTGLSSTAIWQEDGHQVSAYFGQSVACAGDVNGDGFSDVMIGAPEFDNGETGEGRVFVYHGSASGPSSLSWFAEGNQAFGNFGFSVSCAGDVNNDGFDDVIIGAPYYEMGGPTSEGASFVYHGSALGLGSSPAWSLASGLPNANFGYSVAAAGDANGDGFGDVIVGAPYGFSSRGVVQVVYGSSTGLFSGRLLIDDFLDTRFGESVSTAGDITADGFSDVIVGAGGYNSDRGRASVYQGSASGSFSPAMVVFTGIEESYRVGESVATAGDVNGDGFSDVIIGAPGAGQGQVRISYGAATNPLQAGDFLLGTTMSEFGSCVASAGDVNGDGFSDVAIADQFYSNGESHEGAVYVALGSSTGIQPPSWTIESNQTSAKLGVSVATAGDVDGDGFSDILAGADKFNGTATDEGRVFLYRGNGGNAGSAQPLQVASDGVSPVAYLGRSDSGSSFGVTTTIRSIYGRTKLAQEVEVESGAVTFNGLGVTTSSFQDTGSDAARRVTTMVTGLAFDTLYHWRARPRYNLAQTPFLPRGPWRHLPRAGWNEGSVRTASSAVAIPEGPDDWAQSGIALEFVGRNPTAGPASLQLAMEKTDRVSVAVWDIRGRMVARLVDGKRLEAGIHRLEWDGRELSGAVTGAGVYFVKVQVGEETRVVKVVRLGR